MLLILYPINNNKKFERHTFDYVSSKEQAIEALKQLNDVDEALFYNISTTSYSNFFMNLEDFVNDCNNQDVNIDEYWMIYLDLNEQEALDVLMG